MNFRTLDSTSGVRFLGRSFWLLTLLCAALYLPGIATLPPIDRDEARFMQSTKQMIESGDYGRIRFQSEPRDKKPIGAHWLQAGAVNLLSPDTLTATWPYRLPSVLGVWFAVLATALTARRIAGAAAGFAAGAILATSALVIVEAHLAKADGLLLGTAALVFGGLLHAYDGHRLSLRAAILFWAMLGASLLIKGPILPGVVALSVITLGAVDKSFAFVGRLKPALGLPIMLAVAVLWPLVAGTDEVMRFMQSALSQDLLPKLAGGVETHGAPPGTHALTALLTLWPWSWAAPLAAVLSWRQRHVAFVRVCLAWIVPFWLLLELIPTKLPHYPMPLFPALALLIAMMLVSARTWSPLRIGATGLFGLALLGGIAATTLVALGEKLPTVADLNLSRRLAASLKQIAPTAAPVILVGYHEPSAVFLLGTDTVTTNPEAAAGLLTADSNAIAAVEEADLPILEKFVTEAGQKVARLTDIPGYNYSRGTAVKLIVVRATPS